jgi:hypothetical protein
MLYSSAPSQNLFLDYDTIKEKHPKNPKTDGRSTLKRLIFLEESKA